MIYDIIGIGIGPFNLGLAALADEIPNLQCLFADAKENFDWHPGLMIEGTRMQVPFYADLVTLVNPCSRFSYLNFLKAKERLFRFAIHEKYFPTRKEYNEYCKWVVSQLDALHFGKTCTGIFYSRKRECYGVQLRDNNTRNTKCNWARHIVIGTGTIPLMPEAANNLEHPLLFHSAEYLHKKQNLLEQNNITIIGSGQSAAEIFSDLMDNVKHKAKLNWFTRAPRFLPMDYSKLTLEMSSPGYIEYFYKLDKEQKLKTLSGQNSLYKGINFSLIDEIYDKLYAKSLDENAAKQDFGLFTNSELVNILLKESGSFKLQLVHRETNATLNHDTDALILATGYKNIVPEFLKGISDSIGWNESNFYDVQKDYSISPNGKTIFVQNADLYSHGFNSADLGMGPYRNAVILNTILKKEYFKVEKNTTFQAFKAPGIALD